MLLSNRDFLRRMLAAFTVCLLAACGGDDDEPDGNNQPPVATITSPDGASTFRAGLAITFAGSATDPEDGTLGPTRLTWWADLHHGTHTHPLLPATNGSGGTVTFPTRGHAEEDIFIRIHLRATDSAGATHEVTRDVQPQKVQVTLATSPAGLGLTLDGQPVTGPTTFTGVVGIERDLVAVQMQNANARRWQFQSWSDGGTATHSITTPVADTTYTATYQDIGPVTNMPPAVALTAPANNATVTRGTAVTVSATATDADGNGTITSVQFRENGVAIATDSTVPYSITWTPATAGTRTLTAVATDNQGAQTTSASVTVTVNVPTADVQAPTMTGITPANLTANIAAGSLDISATATDNVAVASMEFQVDGVQVGGGLDTTSPYGVSVDTNQYASGQHVIRARARDAAGNVSAWQTATVQFGGSRTNPNGFTRTPNWVSGLSSATAFAQAPDGRWFVAQQGGRLRIVKNGALLSTDFMTLNVDSNGERGLLGVAIHPEFATNAAKRFIYIYHTVPGNPAHNRVTRVMPNTANADIYSVGSEVIIAELPNLSGATNHNGGAMHFGSDGMLYVAVGDNATGSNAPSMTTRHGKMLRLAEDGTIPTNNPFYTTASGENRSIWAVGLRNPFTFAVRASDGRIHINDVGEGTWEEINVGAPGANYGWPSTEGPTNAAGIMGPLYSYDHNANTSPGGFFYGCAITGGTFYNFTGGGGFPTTYRNSYYFADYCGRFNDAGAAQDKLFVGRLDLDTGDAYAFGRVGDAPVDMRVGTDGALYVLTRGGITRFSAP